MRRYVSICCGVGVLLSALGSIDRAITEVATIQAELLGPYVLLRAESQLDRDEATLLALHHAELVESVSNCARAVSAELDRWIDRLQIQPAGSIVEHDHVRVVIDVDKPKRGFIVVNYRVFPDKRRARLDLLFDSELLLTSSEKETIAMHFELVPLKRLLVRTMKCTR